MNRLLTFGPNEQTIDKGGPMQKEFAVYICCPLTPQKDKGNITEFLSNVRKATLLAVRLMRQGYGVICPATDFAYWLVEDGPERGLIYQNDLILVRRCHVMLVMEGALGSENCKKEIQEASKHDIPVFHDEGAMQLWREKQ